jgi:transcription antitermination factor NusG
VEGAGGRRLRFAGFDDKHFEAFEKRKWSSNLFNLERLAVKEELEALGAQITLPLERFSREVTSHCPTILNGKNVSEMLIYYTRTEEERKAILPLLDSRIALPEQLSDPQEHHKHAILGVRISQSGVDTGFMLHSRAWVDVMNILNRCKKPEERARFVQMVNRLDGTAVIAPSVVLATKEFSSAHIEQMEEAVLNYDFTIFFGVSFGRDAKEPRSPAFASLVNKTLLSCLPIYDFALWRLSQDFLGTMGAKTAKEEVSRISVGAHVLVNEGPFANRAGVVTAIDNQGFARVLIGKITLKIGCSFVRILPKERA